MDHKLEYAYRKPGIWRTAADATRTILTWLTFIALGICTVVGAIDIIGRHLETFAKVGAPLAVISFAVTAWKARKGECVVTKILLAVMVLGVAWIVVRLLGVV